MLVTQIKDKKEKLITKNYKVTQEEFDQLKAKADLYTNGNLSAWLRYAGLNHVAKTKDIVKNKISN